MDGARGRGGVMRPWGLRSRLAVAAFEGRGVDDGNGHTYPRGAGTSIEPHSRSRHRAPSARCIEY